MGRRKRAATGTAVPPVWGAYLLPGVTTSMVFSITLPVTDTVVATTAPVMLMAAPAAAPATLTTAQALSRAAAAAKLAKVTRAPWRCGRVGERDVMA